MIRVVVDTNILVAGLSSRRGASHQVLRHLMAHRFSLLASTALWLEYESVLKRPGVKKMHHLADEDIGRLLDALALWVEPVDVNWRWRPQLRDPNDEMVLELALNAAADALVTFNQRDFMPAADSFHLKLVSPAEFLSLLENEP